MNIFTHDSDCCEYIDTIVSMERTSDLYACFSDEGVCIIVRYGNDGPDYTSLTFPLDATKMVDQLISCSVSGHNWTRLLGVVMDYYAWHSDRVCLGMGNWNAAKFIEFAKGKVAA